MDEIISYKMCAVKVRNAKLRNYLNTLVLAYVYSEPSTGKVFLTLLYHIIQR
jgi:hypothetical protein